MSKLDEMRADLTRKYGKAQDTSGSETDNSLAAMRQRLMGKYGSAPTEPAVLPRGMGETEQPPIKQIKKSPAATQQVITGAKEGIRGQQDTRERSYAENAGVAQTVNTSGYGAALSAPKDETPTAAVKVSGKAAVTGAVGGKGGAQQPVTEAEALQQMAQQSEREYRDYLHSEEYKKASASDPLSYLGGVMRDQSGVEGVISGEVTTDPFLEAEKKKSVAGYWSDEATMAKDMESYEAWSDEDKALLHRYISGRLGSDETLFTDIWQMTPMGGIPGVLVRGGQLISAEEARAELARKYGWETVQNMAESVARQRNAQRAQEVQAGAQRHSEGFVGGTISSVGAVGASTMGSITGTVGVVGDLLTRTGRYSTLDPNQAGNLPNIYAGAVKENVSRQIAGEDGNAFREGLALLYQGGMSAAENIARVAAGGKFGSLAMAASGSFGQTVQAASEQGATPEQAITLGIVNAGIEAATEKIPLDNLFGAAKAGNLKQVLIGALKQGGIEATTDEISLLGTTFAEAMILREKSGYNQTIQEQMAQGKNYKEAKHYADMQLLGEAAKTAAVSFISGSLMEGANQIGNYTGTKGTPQQGAGSPQRGEAPTQAATPKKQETAQAEQPGAKEQEAGDYATDLFTRKTTPAQPVQQITPEQAGEAIRDALDNAGVKQQIQASQETLNGMEPVADIQTPVEFSNLTIAEKMKWVIEKLRPTNYQVDRKGFGTINFSAKQLKQAFKYFAKGGADEASFEAIPYVLENGTEISSHENHKGREYSTVTFAAPVTINGKRGNMAVVVRQTTDNRYKIHRVFSPDGKAFDLSETTIEAEPTPGGGVTENGSLATPISSASDNSIANVGEIVNGQQRLDDPNGAIRQALGMESVDTQPNGQYNNGTNYGGTEYAENGEQGLSGAHEAGLPGGAGAGQNGGHDPAGLRVHGRASGDVGTGSQMVPGDVPGRSGTGDPEVRVRASGILRVSAQLRNARDNRGVRSYDLYDTSAFPQEYEQALTAGRNSDPVNGWCVTPKSAQEMAEGNVRTMMNADGTVGVGIAPDGDIVAVFKNKNGGPRGALDTAMPMAIEMGGDRLDCYGKGLVKVYENYGFIPVARVEFNPEYANDGWTPDKGTPYIYVMMHNGDSAAQVTEKMHTYRHATATELDALPTYDKDGYDDAMAYRDGLLRERGQSGDNKLYNEDGTADAGDPGESGMDHGSVGADTTKFKHETRRSKVYDNTYRNATDEDVRKVGQTAEELDPRIAEYEYISEKESLSNAELRTRNKREMNAEYTYLIKKEGWTGEDNDTAMRILKQLQKDGDVERFRALARAQKERGTTGGQFIQSFAKYSRDATKAAVDAVDELSKMAHSDVPEKFYAGRKGDYYQSPAGAVHAMEAKDTNLSHKNRKKAAFEQWQTDITKSILEIAQDIESVKDGDVESMRGIIRQLANFRKTTAWMGFSSKLTKNAERILQKMDFNTAKDIATAQLAKIPDDFRKRSTGQIIKAVRYQNMLSSLISVNRNLVGNATTGMIDAFSDGTAGRFADMLMAKATGKRTIGNDMRYGKDYLRAAMDAGDMAALCAELDIPTDQESKYLEGRTRTFSPKANVLGRFMSAYEKYLNYALGVSDEVFAGGASGAVSKSLEALGEKSGLTQEEISELGQKVGQRRTYKEGRKLAQASSGVKKALNKLGTKDFGAGDMLLAFAEVPAEMGQVAIDYSGGGFIEGLAEIASVIRDAKNGRPVDVYRQRKAAADFGRGLTGPALIAGFTALAAMGIISVHDDEDWDKRALEQSLRLSGAQLNLSAVQRLAKGESTEWQQDDLVMSIDFLQPFNSQMYIGYLLSQEESVGDMAKAYPGAAFRGIVQSVLDIPMMGTFSDIADIATSFAEVEDGDFSAVADATGQFMGDMASGFIPAPVRQVAQFIDPVYRDTTGDDAMEGAVNRVKSMIPGLSQSLPVKYDGLGNKQRRYDNGLLGFFNTFINPGALDQIDTSEIADYLETVGDKSVYPEYQAPKSFKVGEKTVIVSGKEMTEKYQKTYGENIAAMYGELIKSPDFKGLSEEQKIAALKTAKQYAAQKAKAAVSGYADAPKETNKQLAEQIIQSGIIADITKGLAPETGYKQVRDIQNAEAIAGSGMTEEKKVAALKYAGSDAQDENLDAVLAEGYSADQYVEMWRMISDEKEKGGDGTKRRTIQLLADAYRISWADATELYEIFYPKSK